MLKKNMMGLGLGLAVVAGMPLDAMNAKRAVGVAAVPQKKTGKLGRIALWTAAGLGAAAVVTAMAAKIKLMRNNYAKTWRDDKAKSICCYLKRCRFYSQDRGFKFFTYDDQFHVYKDGNKPVRGGSVADYPNPALLKTKPVIAKYGDHSCLFDIQVMGKRDEAFNAYVDDLVDQTRDKLDEQEDEQAAAAE